MEDVPGIVAQSVGGQWVPGDEGDVVLLAVLQDGFVLALGEAVLVLYRDYGNDAAGLFDLLDCDLGESYVTDLSLLL